MKYTRTAKTIIYNNECKHKIYFYVQTEIKICNTKVVLEWELTSTDEFPFEQDARNRFFSACDSNKNSSETVLIEWWNGAKRVGIFQSPKIK